MVTLFTALVCFLILSLGYALRLVRVQGQRIKDLEFQTEMLYARTDRKAHFIESQNADTRAQVAALKGRVFNLQDLVKSQDTAILTELEAVKKNLAQVGVWVKDHRIEIEQLKKAAKPKRKLHPADAKFIKGVQEISSRMLDNAHAKMSAKSKRKKSGVWELSPKERAAKKPAAK